MPQEGWADVETPSRYRTTAGRRTPALELAPDEPAFILERQLIHSSGAQIMHCVLVPFATAEAVPALQDNPFCTSADLYNVLAADHHLIWTVTIPAIMPTQTTPPHSTFPKVSRFSFIFGRPANPPRAGSLLIEEIRLPADRASVTSGSVR